MSICGLCFAIGFLECQRLEPTTTSQEEGMFPIPDSNVDPPDRPLFAFENFDGRAEVWVGTQFPGNEVPGSSREDQKRSILVEHRAGHVDDRSVASADGDCLRARSQSLFGKLRSAPLASTGHGNVPLDFPAMFVQQVEEGLRAS